VAVTNTTKHFQGSFTISCSLLVKAALSAPVLRCPSILWSGGRPLGPWYARAQAAWSDPANKDNAAVHRSVSNGLRLCKVYRHDTPDFAVRYLVELGNEASVGADWKIINSFVYDAC